MGARLAPSPGTPHGLDADHFDRYCDHLLIRVRELGGDGPGQLVGTYRVLGPDAGAPRRRLLHRKRIRPGAVGAAARRRGRTGARLRACRLAFGRRDPVAVERTGQVHGRARPAHHVRLRQHRHGRRRPARRAGSGASCATRTTWCGRELRIRPLTPLPPGADDAGAAPQRGSLLREHAAADQGLPALRRQGGRARPRSTAASTPPTCRS